MATATSVTSNPFKTKITDGLLGSFTINPHGDTTAGKITIYKIVGGRPTILSVITPSPTPHS